MQNLQTDHDFNLEKQQLVHNGKLKVQEEYAQREKDIAFLLMSKIELDLQIIVL